jgi:hypothetical protein
MAVDLFVTGASSRVTATLVFDDDGGALSAGSMLGSMELDALSSALGVSLDLVVDIETVSMAFEEAPKPPSSPGLFLSTSAASAASAAQAAAGQCASQAKQAPSSSPV